MGSLVIPTPTLEIHKAAFIMFWHNEEAVDCLIGIRSKGLCFDAQPIQLTCCCVDVLSNPTSNWLNQMCGDFDKYEGVKL